MAKLRRSEMPLEDVLKLRAADRARNEKLRIAENALALATRLKTQGSYLIKETVGVHVRWCWASRNGEFLDPRYCAAAVEIDPIHLIKTAPGAEYYGARSL